VNAKLDSTGRGEWCVRLVETCGTDVADIVAASERVYHEAKWWIDELSTSARVGQGDVPTLYRNPRVVAMRGWYVVQEILIPTTLYNTAAALVKKRKQHYTRTAIAAHGKART